MGNNKGFTLVELIVVVTILAILGTIGFVSYSSYLTGVRDANRTSQLVAISDGLHLYSTENTLPTPDEKIDITSGATIVGYQGFAGTTVLEIIDYSKAGLDPKDKIHFTYYLSADKKHFQLLAFLEESESLQVYNSLFPQAYANINYQNRYPTVYGDKLGILTDSNGAPAHIAQTNIDITTTTSTYNAILRDDETLTGDSTVLAQLSALVENGGRGYSVDDGNLVFFNPDSSIPRNGLVAEYHFEGNYSDSSGYSNHSSGNAGASFVSGKIGQAMSVTEGGYMVVPNSDSLDISTNKFTLSGWFKFETPFASHALGYPTIMIKRPWQVGGYLLGFDRDNGSSYSQFCTNPNCLSLHSTTEDFVTGQYYHITGVFDGNTLKTYINGVLENTVATSLVMGPSSSDNLTIGLHFGGSLDSIRIYDRDLSSSEVRILYREPNE